MSDKPYLQRMKEFVQENGITGRYREETDRDRAAPAQNQDVAHATSATSITAGYHAWIQREDARMDHIRDAAAARAADVAKQPAHEERLAKVREDAQKRFGRGTVEYEFSPDR